MKLPTARTLERCRKLGILCGVVERRVGPPGAVGVTKDLFGCIDLIAVEQHELGVLGIQATSGSNMSSRLTKATTECAPALRRWLDAMNRFEIWGWRKNSKNRWTLRRIRVTILEGKFHHERVDFGC
jgi:hypothetical protein